MSALSQLVDELIQNHPEQVNSYREGNEKMFNFFVGQIMKQTKGQANPVQTKQLLESKLNQWVEL